jgi:hypothetical protein
LVALGGCVGVCGSVPGCREVCGRLWAGSGGGWGGAVRCWYSLSILPARCINADSLRAAFRPRRRKRRWPAALEAALAAGADAKAFFAGKEAKQHALARRIRGAAAGRR